MDGWMDLWKSVLPGRRIFYLGSFCFVVFKCRPSGQNLPVGFSNAKDEVDGQVDESMENNQCE